MLPERPLEARAAELNDSASRAAVGVPLPEAPYEIETLAPYSEGKAAYRITIRDASRTAFEVERMVRPDIERILRDAFAAENPGASDASVRVYIIPDFGSDRTIRMSGTAFSLEPTTDGWEYDDSDRRGRIRLRIRGGMSPEDLKRWVRENISAIVAEKNVSLVVGKASPVGAKYRSLGETLDNGILTVEFQAEE